MNITRFLNQLACVAVLGCFALGVRLTAVEAPTREEWAPVLEAIAAGGGEAETKLAEITTRYANWPDGWIERARFALAGKRADDAWNHARKALTIQGGNGEAAALGVQALYALERFPDALSVAEKFKKDGSLDKQANGKSGYVNYYAAFAALDANDLAKANEHFGVAMTCAGAAVPVEFHVLAGRIAVASKDLAKAEASYARATNADPRCWNGWYELGRVRHALAEAASGPGGKRNWLDASVRAFSSVTKALPDDFESWLGLGRAQVAIARLEIDDGSDGGGHLRDAVMSLQVAVKRQDDLVAGWVALGEAQLRLEQYADAVTSLSKARSLGVQDPSVLHNLGMALQRSGHAEESLKLLKGSVASTSGELINQGMAYYHNHLYEAAIERLESAAAHPDLANDTKVQGQVLRFAGHAWREWSYGLGGDGKPLNPPATPHETAQRREKAAEVYRRAGDLGDWVARRHFAALQNANGAQTGYTAGWTVLGWNHWLSATGWGMVISNYGAARAWNSPLHKTIWAILIGLPFLLWLKSLFRPKAAVAPRAKPASPAQPAQPAQPGDGDDSSSLRPSVATPQRPSPSQVRTPAPGAKRPLNPLTVRKGRPTGDQRPRMVTTEDAPANRPTPRVGNPPGVHKTPVSETEEIVPPEPTKPPPPKPRPKPR